MTDSINRKISRLARNVTASGTLTTDTVVAAQAARWTTPRNIVLGGDLSGSVTMDGSEHVTLTATISSDTVTLGTDTAGNYVATVTGGTGITVTGSGSETADVSISIDNTVATLTGTETLTNKTISATNNTITIDTDNVSEGSTNLYYTDARARGAFSAGDNITIVDGVISGGSASYTDTDARAAISVTDSGGDGSLAYNNTTGVITYTGPSASEVRAHFTGGTGVAITDGSISIGQDVGTSSNVTFNDLIVSGNLTVSGTTTTINTETINLADNTIVLNSNEAGSPTQNSGIEIERGTSTNVSLLWDETNDRWTIGTESFVAGSFIGNVTGDVTGTVSSLSNHDTDDVSEGSTNLYYTDARARAAFSAGSNITIADGVISGSAAYGDSDARTAISVTDSGGDGSLSYNSTTGVITYTGPSADEVRTHFSAGSGINIVAGSISVASGFVQNYTDADARAAISVSGGLSYNSSTGVITLSGYNNSNWDTAYGWGNHASAGYLVGTVDSEQTGDFGIINWNEGSAKINSDPRINSGGYDADLISIHWWATTAAGASYGRVGHALYNGSAYQYFHTKASQNNLYHNNNVIWTAGNDGSGSGLDADLLDGYHASSFHINSYDNDVTANSVYADNWFRAREDTGLYFQDKGTGVRSVQSEGGQYGSVATYSGVGGYEGFSIGGRVVFMHDMSSGWGIYNDVNNEWMVYGTLNGYVELRYDNSTKIATTSSGISVTGDVSATGNVTAYSSDKRLKTNLQKIEHPLEKINKLTGYYFDWDSNVRELGFSPNIMENEIGLIAQDVQEILPQATPIAPFDYDHEKGGSKSGENYLTVQYEKLVPLLVEAIKEQQKLIEDLQNEMKNLR